MNKQSLMDESDQRLIAAVLAHWRALPIEERVLAAVRSGQTLDELLAEGIVRTLRAAKKIPVRKTHASAETHASLDPDREVKE